ATANTHPAATNPSTTATSTMLSTGHTAARPPKTTPSCCAPTTTASNPNTPEHPPHPRPSTAAPSDASPTPSSSAPDHEVRAGAATDGPFVVEPLQNARSNG